MKKTLITLLAMAGVAMGTTILPTPVGSVDNVTSQTKTFNTSSVNEWTGISVAVSLKTATLAQWIEDYSTGSITIFTMNGGTSQGTIDGGIGLKLHFSDTDASFKGYWGKNGNTYGASSNIAEEGILDGLTSASLVMNYGPDNGVAVNGDAILTLTYGDRQVTETITLTGLNSSAWNVRGDVSVHEGIVSSFDVYNTRLTVAQATEIGKALAPTSNVPEPTTATLSLLALCGLAARRRRH